MLSHPNDATGDGLGDQPRPAEGCALRLLRCQRGLGALADESALQLSERGKHVSHRLAAGRGQVDAEVQHHQIPALRLRALDDVARVTHAARQPIQLRNDESFSIPRCQLIQRRSEAGIHVLAAGPFVAVEGQVPSSPRRLGSECRLLSLQSKATVGLLLSADTQVCEHLNHAGSHRL